MKNLTVLKVAIAVGLLHYTTNCHAQKLVSEQLQIQRFAFVETLEGVQYEDIFVCVTDTTLHLYKLDRVIQYNDIASIKLTKIRRIKGEDVATGAGLGANIGVSVGGIVSDSPVGLFVGLLVGTVGGAAAGAAISGKSRTNKFIVNGDRKKFLILKPILERYTLENSLEI